MGYANTGKVNPVAAAGKRQLEDNSPLPWHFTTINGFRHPSADVLAKANNWIWQTLEGRFMKITSRDGVQYAFEMPEEASMFAFIKDQFTRSEESA